VAERRKKTQGGSDEGKAAGKSPRVRKARREGKESPPQDAALDCGLRIDDCGLRREPAEANPQSAIRNPQSTNPQTASLPGEFYQRASRWWWRVKLPGEDKAKARPLKAEGAKAAAEDRQSAEKIAFAMWEHALQNDAARHIKIESTEKIERLKAQFLDKVRHFTELVATANAKVEAEAKARAEAEAKLAQALQTAGPKPQADEPKTQYAEPPAAPAIPPAREAEAAPFVANLPSPMAPPPAPVTTPIPVVPVEDRLPQPPATPEVVPSALVPTPPLQEVPESEPPRVEIATGICDCCGAAGIAIAFLTAIDSGQSLCPRCLAALRSDIARLDPDSLD